MLRVRAQAFTALDREREEADLAKQRAEKERLEMEEAARDAARELQEAEEAEAEAARQAEEAKAAAAASRKEEEEAVEAESAAAAALARRAEVEQEVLRLKQELATAKKRGGGQIKAAEARLRVPPLASLPSWGTVGGRVWGTVGRGGRGSHPLTLPARPASPAARLHSPAPRCPTARAPAR